MLRPLVLSLLILSLIVAGLPVTDSLAYWNERPSVSRRKKGKYYRRHSRAWWRRRRALLRRRRARALLRRRRAAATARLNRQHPRTGNASPRTTLQATGSSLAPRAPFDMTLPQTWSSAGVSLSGETKFVVRSKDGRPVGAAVLSPVPTSGALAAGARVKTLGGVPVASLRRTVIDRMVAEGGWVINDMEREIAGRRIFVVQAQSGAAPAARQSWTFYFVEVNGRIYNLATNAPVEFAVPLAVESEQFVASLRTGGNGNMASR